MREKAAPFHEKAVIPYETLNDGDDYVIQGDPSKLFKITQKLYSELDPRRDLPDSERREFLEERQERTLAATFSVRYLGEGQLRVSNKNARGDLVTRDELEKAVKKALDEPKESYRPISPWEKLKYNPDLTPVNISSRVECPWVAGLSNFPSAPFILDGQRWESVEAFIQATKVPDPARQVEIAESSGYAAKKYGRAVKKDIRRGFEEGVGYTVLYQEHLIPFGSEAHYNLIARAIRAKFEQNKDFKQALLMTGRRPITHDLGHPESPFTSLPAEVFCQILMDLRHEYQQAELRNLPKNLQQGLEAFSITDNFEEDYAAINRLRKSYQEAVTGAREEQDKDRAREIRWSFERLLPTLPFHFILQDAKGSLYFITKSGAILRMKAAEQDSHKAFIVPSQLIGFVPNEWIQEYREFRHNILGVRTENIQVDTTAETTTFHLGGVTEIPESDQRVLDMLPSENCLKKSVETGQGGKRTVVLEFLPDTNPFTHLGNPLSENVLE